MIENNELNLIIQSIGAAILILCCYMGRGWLGCTPLAKMGDYSYAFYISHFVVLLSCKSIAMDRMLFWCIAMALTLVLTIVLHKLQTRLFNRLLEL